MREPDHINKQMVSTYSSDISCRVCIGQNKMCGANKIEQCGQSTKCINGDIWPKIYCFGTPLNEQSLSAYLINPSNLIITYIALLSMMKLPGWCWLTLKKTAQKSNLSDSNMTNLTWGFESLVTDSTSRLMWHIPLIIYSLCYHQITVMYLLKYFCCDFLSEIDQCYQKEEETLKTQRAGKLDRFPILWVTKHHLLKKWYAACIVLKITGD